MFETTAVYKRDFQEPNVFKKLKMQWSIVLVSALFIVVLDAHVSFE